MSRKEQRVKQIPVADRGFSRRHLFIAAGLGGAGGLLVGLGLPRPGGAPATPSSDSTKQSAQPPTATVDTRLATSAAAVRTPAVAAGALQTQTTRPAEVTKPSDVSPFVNWEKYRNAFLPKDVVLKMGQHMAKQGDYLSIVQAGTVVIENQEQPELLNTYDPVFFPVTSLSIQLMDLRVTTSDFRFEVHGEPGTFGISDPGTGQTYARFQAIKLDQIVNQTLVLDNRLINASESLKMLALADNIATLKSYRKQREIMYSDIARKYNIPVGPLYAQEPFLLGTALAKGAVPDPKIVDSLSYFLEDVGATGIFAILQDYGRMKDQGRLNSSDIALVPAYEAAFSNAMRSGLLQKNQNGEYTWKQGVQPFSLEWKTIARPLLKIQQTPLTPQPGGTRVTL